MAQSTAKMVIVMVTMAAMFLGADAWANSTKPCGLPWVESDKLTPVQINLAGSNKCVDVTGGVAKDGTLLEIWDCNGIDNQKWIFNKDLNQIQYAAAPSLCIDNLGGGAAGNQLGLWTCSGEANQKWAYDSAMKTIYLTSSQKDASLCMDLAGGSITNGNPIQVWGCIGGSSQEWSMNVACTSDGRCQRGNCCSGKTHGTLRCGVSFCEGMCEKAVGFISNKLVKYGCAAIIPEGDVICEAAGLGPEDPLADICAAIVTAGCPIIAHWIEKGLHLLPKDICANLGSCGLTGSRCGCLRDGACADSTGDCCSLVKHHTGACPTNIRCGCLHDGECAGSDGKNGCCSGTSHHTAACGSNIRCGTASSVVV